MNGGIIMANMSLIQGQYYIYTLRILDFFFNKLRKEESLENNIKSSIEKNDLNDAKIKELFDFSEEELKAQRGLFSSNKLSKDNSKKNKDHDNVNKDNSKENKCHDNNFKENKYHKNVNKYMKAYIIDEKRLHDYYVEAIRHVIDYDIENDCNVHKEINALNEENKKNGEIYVDKILHTPVIELIQANDKEIKELKIPIEYGISGLSLREMPPFYYLFFRWHRITKNDLDLVTDAGIKYNTNLKGIISSLSAKRINLNWPIDEIDKYFTYYSKFISDPAVIEALGYSYTDCTDNIDERKEAIVTDKEKEKTTTDKEKEKTFSAADNEIIGLSLLKDLCYVLYDYASLEKPEENYMGTVYEGELSKNCKLYMYPQKTKDNPGKTKEIHPDWLTAFNITFDRIINHDNLQEIVEEAVRKAIKKDYKKKSEKIKNKLKQRTENLLSSKQIDKLINEIFGKYSFRKEIETEVQNLIKEGITIATLEQHRTKIQNVIINIIKRNLDFTSKIWSPSLIKSLTHEELNEITEILGEFSYEETKNIFGKIIDSYQFLNLIKNYRDDYPINLYENMKTNLGHTTHKAVKANKLSENIKYYEDAEKNAFDLKRIDEALNFKIPYIPIIDSPDQETYRFRNFNFIPSEINVEGNNKESDPDKIFTCTEPDLGILNTQVNENSTKIQELIGQTKKLIRDSGRKHPVSEIKIFIHDSTFKQNQQKYTMEVSPIPYFTGVARRDFFIKYLIPEPGNIKKILVTLLDNGLLSAFLPENECPKTTTEYAKTTIDSCKGINLNKIQNYIDNHCDQPNIKNLQKFIKKGINKLYQTHVSSNIEHMINGDITIHNTGTTFCGCGTFILSSDTGPNGERRPWLLLEKRWRVSEEDGNLCYPSAGSCDFYNPHDYRDSLEKYGFAGCLSLEKEANPFKTAARELYEELRVKAKPSEIQFICFGVDTNRNLQQFSFLFESPETAEKILESANAAIDADEGKTFIVPFRKDIIYAILKQYQLEPAAVYALARLVEIKKDLLWAD